MFTLYRGFKNGLEVGEYRNKYLDIPREPLSSPKDIHLRADNWFFAKFGIRFRSQVLFCYGTIKGASDYGAVGIVEPIGEHLMCWSPKIWDMYGAFEEEGGSSSIEEILDVAEYQVFTLEDVSKVSEAIASEHEIMLWCKYFRVKKIE